MQGTGRKRKHFGRINNRCKLVAKDPWKPELGAEWLDDNPDGKTTLEQQIEEDKRYGKLEPHNGVLRYIMLNHDRELRVAEARMAINAAFVEWETDIDIDFRSTRNPSEADIIIEFRGSDEDQLFKDEPHVLAYMYYPIAGSRAGYMVINSDYPWTMDGSDRSGKWIEEKTGKKMQWPDNMYKTWSLFKVTRHELGHGIGLPHSKLPDQTMSSSYGKMSDHNTERDSARGQAKYGKPTRNRFIRIFSRWINRHF